ncbi:MAG TPA: hypothetical protein VL127_20100 [Bryobacteraceae bacterium]|nr:hypothetical protein [Bryobacteraceae bacterium]
MTKKFILPAVLLLGISGAALAADIDGKWTAEVEGRRGTVTQTLVLKASGSTLAGSFEGARGGAVDISDGTIDGNNVSFKVIRDFNGNQFTQQYQGTLSDAGELKLTVSMGGGGGFGGKGGRGGRGGERSVVFKKAAN